MTDKAVVKRCVFLSNDSISPPPADMILLWPMLSVCLFANRTNKKVIGEFL